VSDDLLDRLSSSLRPTPAGLVLRRLLIGLAVGGAVSLALVAAFLGPRQDFAPAALQPMFWVKFGYALAIAGAALWAGERLARPGGLARGRLAWLSAPLLIVAALALWRLAEAPAEERMGLVMGHSARLCPWYVLAASLAPFAGLVWAVRALAPTRLRVAGLVLGLAAGGMGAFAYATHCDEMAAPFLATWYTLGVGAAGVLGWLTGPRLMRW
jgi:hypothetical protein